MRVVIALTGFLVLAAGLEDQILNKVQNGSKIEAFEDESEIEKGEK